MPLTLSKDLCFARCPFPIDLQRSCLTLFMLLCFIITHCSAPALTYIRRIDVRVLRSASQKCSNWSAQVPFQLTKSEASFHIEGDMQSRDSRNDENLRFTLRRVRSFGDNHQLDSLQLHRSLNATCYLYFPGMSVDGDSPCYVKS